MAVASIGSVRVSLGLDSAQFSDGIKKASRGLRRFSSAAKTGLLVFAAAGAAAAVGLGFAVKRSIDAADALSKTAQMVGTTTEALSRLQWAANLSGVSISELSNGVRKLSQNMLDISEGRGAQAASAFAALGIEVVDLEGNLRSSDAVMYEIAAKFSSMEDGAQKTALAMNIFGRAGAVMIPMLNSGADGLAAMARESDKLGLTISTRTGRAAEAFNDTLTRIRAILTGVINKIVEAALPALNSLANTLNDPRFADGAIKIAEAIIGAFDLAAKAIGRVGEALLRMGPIGNRSLEVLREQLAAKLPLLKGDRWIWNREGLEKEIAEIQAAIKAKLDPKNFDVANVFDSLFSVPQFEGSAKDFFQQLRDNAKTLSTSIPPVVALGDAMSATGDKALELMDGIRGAGAEISGWAKSLADAFNGVGSEMMRVLRGTGTFAEKMIGIFDILISRVQKFADTLLDQALNAGLNMLFSAIFPSGASVGQISTGNTITGSLSLNSGGYTGGGALNQVAGIVHGQEYVMNAAATSRIGVRTLNALNTGQAIPANVNGDKTIIINNSITINTPDIGSFRQSEQQISARLAQMTRRGVRNL